MKVRTKILGLLGLMILMTFCILALFMLISRNSMQKRGSDIIAKINSNAEKNVRNELQNVAANISNYVLTLEAEIDKNMLNAARVLYEVDRYSGGRLTLADLERVKRETRMSDLYLTGMDGVFTLSTEPGAAGISLFNIWDGYRMLVTGKSDYLPSDLKVKVETGEIFKFTAIPRADKRGILQSALDAGTIEADLQHFISSNKSIRTMNLFDYSLMTLTSNQAAGVKPVYTKGSTVPKGTTEIDAFFKGQAEIKLTMDGHDARIYYPIIDGKRVRYVLFIDLDTTDYFVLEHLIEDSVENLIKDNTYLNRISISAVFAALLIFTIFIAFLTSRLLKPLGFFDTLLGSFSEGNFTLKVPESYTKRKDEMGLISASFVNTQDKMKRLIATIKNQGDSLHTIGEEMADNMSQTSLAVNGITGNIKNMTVQTGNQSTGVAQTGKSVEKIMQTINELHDQIVIQSDNVSRSTKAVEDVLKNIHMVVETLTKNSENVSALTESSEVGRKDLQKVSEDLQGIARESEGILEINKVMENIASQTNLLSMNAAIEAAHAGEAGKGFAVVAGEIRKLAESSGQQSKTTSDMLKKIKASIDAITNSMAVVFQRFESIEKEVFTVSRQEEKIRTMMLEQEQGSQTVLSAIGELNKMTESVKLSSRDMADKSREVIAGNENIEVITAQISEGMNGIAKGAEQINTAVLRVNEISVQNKESISTLTAEIDKFKVE